MGWPIVKQASPFYNGPAHFKTGQTNLHLLNWADQFLLMGWPIFKQAAGFKMGQILNRTVT